MFGILKPDRSLLDDGERWRHASTYCNLCGLLGSRYAYKSRMLVVHDIATLWWLLEQPEQEAERPLAIANCVWGGSSRLRLYGLTDNQRFLSALSAYTIGVKVADDLADGGTVRTKLADRLYGDDFDQARSELVELGFDVDALEGILARQREIEDRGEVNFEAAAEPTAQAYGLVARSMAARLNSNYSCDDAGRVGEFLGRAVYLVDAVRDYRRDFGRSYNPLCLSAGSRERKLPQSLRHEVLTFIGQGLNRGREIVTGVAEDLRRSWHAVERALLVAAGVRDHRSVTLYINCFFPCGGGVVQASDGDCVEYLKCCCCCVVCWAIRT